MRDEIAIDTENPENGLLKRVDCNRKDNVAQENVNSYMMQTVMQKLFLS